MLITTVCPRCQTSYQVQETLRGKPMRCPNERCRYIFLVGEPRTAAPATPAGPQPASQQSGSVGDLIPLIPVASEPVAPAADLEPLLPAEPVDAPALEPIQPAEAPPRPSWFDPPPVRRTPSSQPVEEPAPPPAPERPRHNERPAPQENVPRVVPSGTWEAPPVRRDKPPQPEPPTLVSEPPPAVVEEPVPVAPPSEPVVHDTPPPHGRWVRLLIIGLSLVSFLALGVGGYVGWKTWQDRERRLAEQADKDYDDGLFRSAAKTYDKLLEDFKDSEQAPRYQFRKELSEIRARVADRSDSPTDLLARMEQLLEDHRKTPILSEHGVAIGDALIKLLTEYGDRAAENPGEGKPLEPFERARSVLKLAQAIKLERGVTPPDWAKVASAETRVRQAIDRLDQRRQTLARLDQLVHMPSFRSLQRAEQIVRDQAATLPGLSTDAEVRKRLQQIQDAHLASVTYVEDPPQARGAAAREEMAPALLFDPVLRPASATAPESDGVVLSLARGVLYAQRPSDGKVRWAMRVGIDTTTLPVRVPAGVGSRERILVLSSDTATLTALDIDGNALWRYYLGTPSLGRPVVVDQRAYLATFNGDVHEIELVEGRRLGRFRLGHRLTLGGTREPGTRRVYFPADDGCIYVLDVARRRCDMILYSRHPSGSLRGEPIVIPPEGEDSSGYLILTQAVGLRAVELRVFDLPLRGPHAAARPLEPAPVIEGWTWFQPHHDSEKVVMLSDAGVLGLFGIRQPRNRDQALFPLLPGGGLHLPGLLGMSRGESAEAAGTGQRGRSEVVQVQDNDLWTLAAGRLQRFKLAWGQEVGPRLVGVWKRPPVVGSPLHASQIIEDRAGRSFLVTVTQPARQSACWTTCVDDERGEVRWQRQLGLVCQTEPITLPSMGEPLLLALDQNGALVGLDPVRYQVKEGTHWLSAARDAHLAGSLEDNADQSALVLPAADGRSAWVVAFPGGRREMVLRHVQSVAGERRLTVGERRLRLPRTLAGQPALVAGHLVLPLDDGTLARVPVPLPDEAPEPDVQSNWRGPRADADASCWVVALGGDRFLSTDGGRGLSCWEWPAGKACVGLPGDERPTLEMKDRIVAAPLRLPDRAGEPVRLCVADSAGVLSLLEVKANGALEVKRTWPMGGPITTGPWLLSTPAGPRVACIVAGNRLVWLDPGKEGPGLSWTAQDTLVGQPRLAEGRLITADQQGRFTALDPASGKPLGKGYQLQGSVAPVCSPVAFHKGRLLAPLSDGTTLLLALDRLLQ